MTNLNELRKKIDDVDRQIVILLAERASYVRMVMDEKQSESEAHDPMREAEVYRTRAQWAREAGLDPIFVNRLWKMMLAYFVKYETQEIAKRNNAHD